MADRITRDDLAHALASHAACLSRCGLLDPDAGRLALDEGSRTYGRAYRLAWVPTGETGHHRPPVGGDYLGMTAREAYDELTGRTSLIYDVVTALARKGDA